MLDTWTEWALCRRFWNRMEARNLPWWSNVAAQSIWTRAVLPCVHVSGLLHLKERGCLQCATTLLVCVWYTLFSGWWWCGMHALGQLDSEVSIMFSRSKGILCSFRKLFVLYLYLYFILLWCQECWKGNGDAGSLWAQWWGGWVSTDSWVFDVHCAALSVRRHTSLHDKWRGAQGLSNCDLVSVTGWLPMGFWNMPLKMIEALEVRRLWVPTTQVFEVDKNKNLDHHFKVVFDTFTSVLE